MSLYAGDTLVPQIGGITFDDRVNNVRYSPVYFVTYNNRICRSGFYVNFSWERNGTTKYLTVSYPTQYPPYDGTAEVWLSNVNGAKGNSSGVINLSDHPNGFTWTVSGTYTYVNFSVNVFQTADHSLTLHTETSPGTWNRVPAQWLQVPTTNGGDGEKNKVLFNAF